MRFATFIALLVVSVLTSAGIATVAVGNSTATKSQKADTVVPSSSSIGKTEFGSELVRMDDTSKGVACYILDNHRAMSCVRISP